MKTVAVALSGGIDSALSAFLLKKEGYRIIGLHADFGFSSESPLPWLKKIASFLDIPLEVLSLKGIFQQEVVDYFISQYALGRTPNPCVVCNPTIKFGLLYQKGLSLGADFFATGHYARIVPAPWGEGLTIARGRDREKDQSYFLHRLEAQDLQRILFPLGDWTKKEVKAFAREIGLPIHPKGESQDICFLPQGGYREFLLQQAPDLVRSGDIVDRQGKKLGTHQGLFAYTVGQRKGLGLPAAEPYYVIHLEPDRNRLVIGNKKDLESAECRLSDFHFLNRPPEIDGLKISVQIRYRHKPAGATLRVREDRRVDVDFQTPQKAVTPGQAAVAYLEDFLIGGGWIEKPGENNPPRVAVYTLGCKVNQFESACLEERFQAQGWEAVSFKEKADFYIVNTCAVTHEAQRQSAQMVRQCIKNYPDSLIVAAGCAAQLFPEDYEKIPGLDYIAGTFNKLEIPLKISSLEKMKFPRLLLCPEAEHTMEAQFPKIAQRTRATVRIQEGCNGACSYCLVPRARGRSRSLPGMDVLSGVEALAGQGIKELILTGIHLGQYGGDLSPSTNLVSLMDLLLQTHPHLYFRLSSLEPQEVTPALLGLFKKYPNLCKHLHIPLQAGEDSLLKKMSRTYSTEFYGRLIRTIHREMPYAAIGADLIVGFPGEENTLFHKIVNFISDLPLSYLHIFPYSRRPGTPAADFPGSIPEKIKKERLQIIRALDREKREAFMGRCLGQVFSALVLQPGREKGWVKALTENYLTVSIPGKFKQNDRLRVCLKASDLSKGLIGEVLS